jgi:hypothetical protein
MRSIKESSPVAFAAAAAAALLFILCTLTAATGVSQQWFEWFRTPEEYATKLVHDAMWLRVIIAVDDVFISAYVTATVLFATALARGRMGPLHVLVMAGGVAAGILDLEENHHLLAMLRMVESGQTIPIGEIMHRTDLSQLKWMLGHVAFVMVGVAMPARDAVTRVFRFSLVAWQLPVGALCWAVEAPAWQPVLVWVRYLSLLGGFATVAWITRASARAEGAAIGSGAPA